MMAVRRIRAERSPNRAAHLRQEHNTLLARMPPDTMCTGLARAAARGIQACGQTVAHFFGTDHARSRGTLAFQKPSDSLCSAATVLRMPRATLEYQPNWRIKRAALGRNVLTRAWMSRCQRNQVVSLPSNWNNA